MTAESIRAAVCRTFGEPLTIERLVLAAPQRDEVEVDVRAVAICHSDIHFAQGAWGGRLPAVYGHEAAGVVRAVGDGVEAFAPGDHVVVTLIRSCGACFHCARGDRVACEATFRLDREGPLSTLTGDRVVASMRTGAFAERVLVHASQLAPIPAEMPFAVASLLGCGVITGYGAVVNTAQVAPGDTVAVIGVGGVGLNAIQGARISGANPVIAIDLSEEKLAASREFGATHGLNAASVDLADQVRALTGGRGADYVFVAVGATRAIEQSMTLIRRGGTSVLVGMPATGATITLDPVTIASEGQRILGTKMGSARLPIDIPRLVGLYGSGALKLDELVTGRFALADINEAIAQVVRGEALRNVVEL
jgi:Zn-dependent alcohol dehydrogenase